MFNFTNKEGHPVDLPGTHLCVPDGVTIPVTTEQMQNLILECGIAPECFVPILPDITIEDIENLELSVFKFGTIGAYDKVTCKPKIICVQEADDGTMNTTVIDVPDNCTLDRYITHTD